MSSTIFRHTRASQVLFFATKVLVLSAFNVKDKITMVENVVLITELVLLKSFLFSDRRCLTAFFHIDADLWLYSH